MVRPGGSAAGDDDYDDYDYNNYYYNYDDYDYDYDDYDYDDYDYDDHDEKRRRKVQIDCLLAAWPRTVYKTHA